MALELAEPGDGDGGVPEIRVTAEPVDGGAGDDDPVRQGREAVKRVRAMGEGRRKAIAGESAPLGEARRREEAMATEIDPNREATPAEINRAEAVLRAELETAD